MNLCAFYNHKIVKLFVLELNSLNAEYFHSMSVVTPWVWDVHISNQKYTQSNRSTLWQFPLYSDREWFASFWKIIESRKMALLLFLIFSGLIVASQQQSEFKIGEHLIQINKI